MSTDHESAAEIDGPWVIPEVTTGLTERCRKYWNTPIRELPDQILATFLRQRIALSLCVPEANRRIDAGKFDGSELYDGELAQALYDIRDRI